MKVGRMTKAMSHVFIIILFFLPSETENLEEHIKLGTYEIHKMYTIQLWY